MAIKLPQDQNIVTTNRLQIPRTPASQAPQIDNRFIGGVMRDNAAREQERLRAEQRKETEKRNLAKAKVENILSGEVIRSQSEAVTLQGENAVTGVPKVREKLSERTNSIIADLEEPYQQEFSILAEQALTRFDRTAIPHELNQGKAVEQNVYKSRVKNLLDEAVANSGDIQAFETVYMPNVINAAEEFARLQYGGAVGDEPSAQARELINNDVNLVVSSAIKQSIQAKANAGMVQEAEQMISRLGNRINSVDMKVVGEAMNKARRLQTTNIAMELSSQASELYPDDIVEQDNYIRALLPEGVNSGDIYREAITFSRTNRDLRDSQKKRNEQAHKSQVYNDAETMIKNGGQLTDQFKRSVEEMPDIADRQRVYNYIQARAKGEDIATDWSRVRELEYMWRYKQDEFSNLDLIGERGRINATDLKPFIDLQRRMIQDEKGRASKIVNSTDKAVADIVDVYAGSKGIMKDTEEYSQIFNKAMTAYQTLIESKPSGLTPQEVRKRISDSLYNSNTERVKPYFGGPLNPVNWFRSTGLRVQEGPLSIDTSSTSSRINAHPSWIEAIQANRKSRNQEPFTDTQLQELLRRQLNQNPNTNFSLPYSGR